MKQSYPLGLTLIGCLLVLLSGCDNPEAPEVKESSEAKIARELGFESIELMREAKSIGYIFNDDWKRYQQFKTKKQDWDTMNQEYKNSLVDVILPKTVFCTDAKDMYKPEKVKTFDEVINCYRITGNENIVMEVVLKNQKHLESFIDQLITYGETKTQIVLSHVVKHSEIKPLK